MHFFNVCFTFASCLMILFGEKVLKSVREQILVPTKNPRADLWNYEYGKREYFVFTWKIIKIIFLHVKILNYCKLKVKKTLNSKSGLVYVYYGINGKIIEKLNEFNC